MTDLDDVRRRWLEVRPRFEQFGSEVANRLRRSLRDKGIWGDVSSRAKEVDSLIRKLIKKPSKTYESLGDKAGVRIVLRYKDEIQPAIAIANKLFDCSEPDDKVESLGPEKVGYLSTHVDVRLYSHDALATRFPSASFSAELQVRTLAQHLWSEMSHDTIYKNDETLVPLPVPLKRRIFILAGLIEVADDEFNRLNKEMPTIPEVELLKSLECNYFKLTTRRGDPEVSLELIRALYPLYRQDTREIAAHLDEFYSSHEEVLRSVYEEAETAHDRSAFLYQPEALMIYDLLSTDATQIRRAWNERYPERELERIANAFGISFD
jgi:ppGpp synthetase/RelA/SpoT-type nucleotidyltranferase